MRFWKCFNSLLILSFSSDFQKAAAFLKEFLLKLNEDIECAELRDTLTLALLHMQKYYRLLQCRTQERTSQHQLTLSARGLSPMTPFVDAPDKFQWKWISLDSAKYLNSLNQQDEGFYHLPDIILAIREGNTEWINKIIQQGRDFSFFFVFNVFLYVFSIVSERKIYFMKFLLVLYIRVSSWCNG